MGQNLRTIALLGFAAATGLANPSARAAPVPRAGPLSGRIVATKQGETAVLVPAPAPRPAEVRQDLKAGDVLRTNAAGTLAIVFADRTQIRLGRNSTLVVRQVRQGSPSSVSLQGGSLWARSPRGASQLSVETPSATAAIRGTEYSIVASEEQTTLTVIEGAVDFFNPQGQLIVSEGQSAAARLGQMPTRIFTVNPSEREQMLYYLSLDSALSYLRPASVAQRAARDAANRVKAIDPASRSVDDWLALAESGAEIEPRATVALALAQARTRPLSATQEARAQLVEAGVAIKDKDFATARRLYQDALPGLTGRQAEVARFGVFITRTLTDPGAAGAEPPALNEDEPVSYVGQAFLAAYLGDFQKARSLAEAGLKRFPDESSLHAMLGGIGLLTGDEKAMEAASRQALLVDPQDAFAMRLKAELDMNYRGNPQAAVRSAEQAVRAAPADDELWNILAQAHGAWDQGRQAERAFQAGLAEMPNSFILHVNRALTLFQQGRLRAARKELAIARPLDPESELTYLTAGFIALTDGRKDEALANALSATAANPTYSEALLLLAELYHDRGEYELAEQQVDAADRADPNNPYVALYRAAFATDRYQADKAIVAAREVLRRYRARGGIYASLSESKGAGSYIAGAFRLLKLDEWARYYGDRTYDPFVAATLFDRSLSAVANPYVFRNDYQPFDPENAGHSTGLSDALQGIRLEPLSIAGAKKDLQLTRQKFIELSLVPSVIASRGDVAFSQAATVNGVLFDPVPLAFNVTVSRDRLDLPVGRNNDRNGRSIQAFFGLKATPYDSIVLSIGHSRQRSELTGTVDQPRTGGDLRDKSTSILGVYAHQFDRENVLSLGGGLFRNRRLLQREDQIVLDPDIPLAFDTRYLQTTRIKAKLAVANYALGFDKGEIQVGGEYSSSDGDRRAETVLTLPPFDPETDISEGVLKLRQHRAYADLRLTPSNALTLEAQLGWSGSRLGSAARRDYLEMSGGVAAVPAPGHWLRAGYVRSNNIQLPFTLGPTSTVGLRAFEAPLGGGVRSRSFIGRWEAEWSAHVFTVVDAQHQSFDGISFEKANLVDPIDPLGDADSLGVRSLEVGPSKVDRISANASFWLTGNIGLRAVYALAASKVRSGPGAGRSIPFLPRHSARVQATWTNDARIRISGGLGYVGRRIIALDGTTARRAWLGDAQVDWQPFERRVQISVALSNLFNQRLVLNPGVPGFGRVFTASLDFRF